MEKIIKVYSDSEKIGEVRTNRNLTIEEALWSLGYDMNSQEDCHKAYEEGWGFLDDCGNYFIDVELMVLIEAII